MSMDQFFTQETGNKGKKVFLHTPTGDETKEYIVLLSIDSDAYQMACIKKERRLLTLAQIESEDERDKFIRSLNLDLLQSLITDWSFDQPCTPENVRAFLIKAPQIANQVDVLSAQRDFFFAPSAKSSKSTPESN